MNISNTYNSLDNHYYHKGIVTTIPKTITDAFVGFDKMFDKLTSFDAGSAYPPFNVVKLSDDEFVIQLAVAGFSKNELTVTEENGTLAISGEITSDETKNYLYRGIGSRKFTKRFALAEYMKVVDTWYENGLISVCVIREVPESVKPKTFKIK